jgi:CheY-like chemotaxis protein
MSLSPIVWIDDDLDYMLLAKRVLRNSGVSNPVICLQGLALGRSYLACFSLREASAALPCLIIVEVREPIVDAILFLARIRRRFATVPALLLDARSGIDAEKANELGATAVLPRVLDRAAIDALVARIIQEWL